MAVQPTLVAQSNEFVNRIIYANIPHGLDLDQGVRATVRKQFTLEMQKQGWYPKFEDNRNGGWKPKTSFLFYGRNDNDPNDNAEDAVVKALEECSTNFQNDEDRLKAVNLYQYAIFKPATAKNEQGFALEFMQNLFEQ